MIAAHVSSSRARDARLFGLLLAVVLFLSAFAAPVSAQAGVNWPAFSSSRPIIVYTIKAGNCAVYDSSHRKESGHYTEKGDEVHILSISDGWARISYPLPPGEGTPTLL